MTSGRWLLTLAALLLCAMTASRAASAEGGLYALASKRTDDINFIVAFKAFTEEARKNGDRAIHIGSPGAAHFRTQDQAIAQALGMGLSGLALSVTFSEYLASHSLKAAEAARLPVITFDSDLEPGFTYLRRGYVGPDNIEFGQAIGALARKLHPRGGKVWLMSADERNTNLADRIHGIRQALSGDAQYPRGQRLSGEGGWTENKRSPWYCGDDLARAQEQLRSALQSDTDVFLSVGHWPLASPAEYLATTAAFQPDIAAQRRLIIVGIGTPNAAQLDLLRHRQITGFVVIDFGEIGRLSFRMLKKAASGERIPDRTIAKNMVLEQP